MSNLIRGEFYKLRKSRYFIGMILLSLVSAFLIMSKYDDNIHRLAGANPEIASGMYSIYYPFTCIIYTSFLFSLFAGEFIARDLKNNISKSFIYGYKRSEVILSKLIVFITFSLFIELIYSIIVFYYAGRAYWFDYDVENILALIRIIGIGILYNVATISIVAMIAVITKNILVTICSPILFSLLFPILVSQTFVSVIVAYLCPFIIGEAAIARFAPTSDIIIGIISSLVTLVITIGGSLIYTKREDVK
ncbi:ABC transporter permease [Clostridium sp. C2-6-12]|uniref:ABC transporter permease n=1 Tax=Clostridium sp. C2-6-12 TaxID=2698832 RepID=UPI00137073A0|nr:ABC transporter permease [Clostridium sp. C2-6-12]